MKGKKWLNICAVGEGGFDIRPDARFGASVAGSDASVYFLGHEGEALARLQFALGERRGTLLRFHVEHGHFAGAAVGPYDEFGTIATALDGAVHGTDVECFVKFDLCHNDCGLKG